MIAAIYARKSTDQNLPDAEKSVTRQNRARDSEPGSSSGSFGRALA
jgi:hypothetical protein